jgi:hypothetical protein
LYSSGIAGAAGGANGAEPALIRMIGQPVFENAAISAKLVDQMPAIGYALPKPALGEGP